MVKGFVKFISVVTASVLAFTLAAPSLSSNAANYEWRLGENGKQYWYEFGVRQGTFDDPKGVIGDGTVRGREIYDPESNAWYWLDSIYNGAKAIGKEVWMPYVYQDEAGFDDATKLALSKDSDAGLQDLVYRAMRDGEGKWVRYDENGKMLNGWVTIEGALAEVYADQIGNTYYYDHKTGIMARGYIEIGGVTYHFDEITGKCLNYDGATNDDSEVVDNSSERSIQAVMHLTDETRFSAGSSKAAGDIAPDFTVQPVNGKSFTLSKHNNELTIINFWATWCNPCVSEMPDLQQLYDENIDGVNIVCINLGESKEWVDQFVEENGFTMNIAYDEDKTVREYYPSYYIPYTVLVKNGEVVWTGEGSRHYRSFKTLVDTYK